MLDRGLCHFEGEAAIDSVAHRNFVQHAPVDADDRDCTEVAAALDGLTKDMWAVGAHECRYFDTIHDCIHAGFGLGLRADCIDAGIGAAAFRQVLDAVVDARTPCRLQSPAQRRGT
jgi:hypothetical protein